MGRNPTHWLAAFRRRKRAILVALLPAVALSAVSPMVCAAMVGASSETTVALQEAHAHHDAAEPVGTPTDGTPSFPPCPHCPGSGAANAGHCTCSAADDQDDGRGPKPAVGERTHPRSAHCAASRARGTSPSAQSTCRPRSTASRGTRQHSSLRARDLSSARPRSRCRRLVSQRREAAADVLPLRSLGTDQEQRQ